MGNGNQLAGADEMKRPSIRVHADLLDEFDDWVADSDEYESRTNAVRSFMRDAINGRPSSDVTPLHPPAEDRLAVAYRKLCQAAYPNGKVRPETAERVCANGPGNLSKAEVMPLVLKPLHVRGYLKMLTDPIYGKTAWEINGWEK